jgi:Domain of unknown function (DUF1707)
MALIGDRERDRVAASLRRHYLQGRLSVEELAERTELALRARSHLELRAALLDLPAGWLQDVVEPAAKAAGNALARAGLLLALLTAWGLASFLLLVVFAIAVLVHGTSVGEVVGFPLAWLALSYGLWRVWQHGTARRA